MNLRQRDHRAPRAVVPRREADEIGEEHGGVLLAHLRERRVLDGEAVDRRRREIARQVAALALERRLAHHRLPRARDDQRQ